MQKNVLIMNGREAKKKIHNRKRRRKLRGHHQCFKVIYSKESTSLYSSHPTKLRLNLKNLASQNPQSQVFCKQISWNCKELYILAIFR